MGDDREGRGEVSRAGEVIRLKNFSQSTKFTVGEENNNSLPFGKLLSLLKTVM